MNKLSIAIVACVIAIGGVTVMGYVDHRPASRDEIQKAAIKSECAKQIFRAGRHNYLTDVVKSPDSSLDGRIWLVSDMGRISEYCDTVEVINKQDQIINELASSGGKNG